MAQVLFDLSANKADEGSALGESPMVTAGHLRLLRPFGICQFDVFPWFSRVICSPDHPILHLMHPMTDPCGCEDMSAP